LLGRLAVGAEVRVTTSAFADLEVTGAIDVVAPVLDAATRSARVVAVIDNPDGRLRPGMSAEVAVVLSVRDDALTVPSEAVFVQAGQTMVYVVAADSTVAPRPVVLGLRRAEIVEVTDGLEAGAQVVRAGHQKIYPGARVMPVETGR
jgi:membrane fusion protein (multidrug efflux system)